MICRNSRQLLNEIRKAPRNSWIIFDEAGVTPMFNEKQKCATCGHPLQCHAFFADTEGKHACRSQIKKGKAVFICSCKDFKR